MRPVRLAVICAGVMGKRHVQLITAHTSCSFIGICDVDFSLAPVAEALNVPFYRDTEELIERERPGGAIISTPNGGHAVIAEVGAHRSVHILIEKPIADSLNDAHRIIQVANDTGIQVLVAHYRRHNSLI